jgi:hypothetical protein
MQMDKEQFKRDPRDYALEMVNEGMVDPMLLLQAALNWMSHDEVREMLDANELSPRFSEDEEDEDEDGDDPLDDFNYVGSRHHY